MVGILDYHVHNTNAENMAPRSFVLIVLYLLSAVYSTHNCGKSRKILSQCAAMGDNNKAYSLPTIETYKGGPIQQIIFYCYWDLLKYR